MAKHRISRGADETILRTLAESAGFSGLEVDWADYLLLKSGDDAIPHALTLELLRAGTEEPFARRDFGGASLNPLPLKLRLRTWRWRD